MNSSYLDICTQDAMQDTKNHKWLDVINQLNTNDQMDTSPILNNRELKYLYKKDNVLILNKH